MIIFDLDNVLCDTSHRRHFIDPAMNNEYSDEIHSVESIIAYECDEHIPEPRYKHKITGEKWKPDYAAYDNACDGDGVISSPEQVMAMMWMFKAETHKPNIQIWTGRSEAVRDKTQLWLESYAPHFDELKMRPVGNTEPAWKLKEMWLDSFVRENRTVDFVFDADPDSISMWRRRGVFCFDCRQD